MNATALVTDLHPSPTLVQVDSSMQEAGLDSVWLITPATAPHRFDTARTSGADLALLDLEDSVRVSDKDAARLMAIEWLSTAPENEATALGVRINALNTAHGLRDVVALAEAGLADIAVLVPKVETARDVELVADVLGVEATRRVWALIETPGAIQCLPEILSARPLAGVAFGSADYAAACGCARTGAALRYARSALIANAAAAGLPAIDSPSFDVDDIPGLQRDAEDARELGFAGKVAIHTRQLPIIRAAFRPSADEVATARAVLAAAESGDSAIVTVAGQMVGPPLLAAARTVLARAGRPITLGGPA